MVGLDRKRFKESLVHFKEIYREMVVVQDSR
jgi:hypothetical protein